MVKKALRITGWILGKAAIGSLLYLWLAKGVQGAHNIVGLLTWITFLVSPSLLTTRGQSELAKDEWIVPRRVSRCLDWIIMLILAWYGAWVLVTISAITYVILEIGLGMVNDSSKDAS